jgi:ABC-type spermidine/putrescine transport system permease subunit I
MRFGHPSLHLHIIQTLSLDPFAQQFLVVDNWGFGSAISVVMIVLILLSMAIMSFFEGEEKDVALW